jgi:hypothetical protein
MAAHFDVNVIVVGADKFTPAQQQQVNGSSDEVDAQTPGHLRGHGQRFPRRKRSSRPGSPCCEFQPRWLPPVDRGPHNRRIPPTDRRPGWNLCLPAAGRFMGSPEQ